MNSLIFMRQGHPNQTHTHTQAHKHIIQAHKITFIHFYVNAFQKYDPGRRTSTLSILMDAKSRLSTDQSGNLSIMHQNS